MGGGGCYSLAVPEDCIYLSCVLVICDFLRVFALVRLPTYLPVIYLPVIYLPVPALRKEVCHRLLCH